MSALFSYFSKGGPAILPLCVAAFFLYHAIARYYLSRWSVRYAEGTGGSHTCDPRLVGEALAGLDRQLRFIRVMTYILPLLGLLGTVIGMVKTFEGLSLIGTGMDAVGGTVSAGIAEALLSTQTGLGFALPALVVKGFINQDLIRLRALYRIALLEEEEGAATTETTLKTL